MQFRPIEIIDLPDVLSLIKELASHEKRPNVVTATVSDLKALLFTDHPLVYGFVAVEENRIVGYALVAFKVTSFQAKKILYIDDLYLQKQVRGQGSGVAFMQQIAYFARSHACVEIQWSALDFNNSALNFYQAIGSTIETGVVHFSGDQKFIQHLLER